jgi:hypothetical protein
MKVIKNIDWDIDRDFPDTNDMKDETYFADDCWSVKFDWNGYDVTAIVDLELTLATTSETGARGLYNYDDSEVLYNVEVVGTHLELKELYYKDGEDFIVDAKEFHEIQTQLLTELNILV